MSDDLRKAGRPDRDLINTNEDHEVRYWTTQMGVTKDELLAAIKRVGNSATKVRADLKK